MNEAVIGLALAYSAVMAILAGLVIFSHWALWIRAGCVLMVTGLYFVTYTSLTGMLGWPTQHPLPERFILLASSINEPDKREGTAGSIHIWATSLEGDRPALRPRAYALPYDAVIHNTLAEADKRRRDGNVQIGLATTFDDERDERPTDQTHMATPDQRITVEDLPDPRLPEK